MQIWITRLFGEITITVQSPRLASTFSGTHVTHILSEVYGNCLQQLTYQTAHKTILRGEVVLLLSGVVEKFSLLQMKLAVFMEHI